MCESSVGWGGVGGEGVRVHLIFRVTRSPLSPLSWCVGFSTILVCSVFSLFVCHFKIPLCSLLSTLSAFLLAPSQVRILSHPGWVGATAGSRERDRFHPQLATIAKVSRAAYLGSPTALLTGP